MGVEYQDELAFGWVRLEVCGDFFWSPDEVFFEFFCQFAHQGYLDVAVDLADFFYELVDVMRACVKDLRGFFILEFFQEVYALGTLFWREVLEGKVVCGHATGDEGGDHGAAAGDCPHVDAVADTFADQVERGVGNPRRAGIAHESDVALVLQVLHVFRSDFFLVEVVVRLHGSRNPVCVEEYARMARVFCQDQGNFFQDANRSVGNIFHVPDRGRYDV